MCSMILAGCQSLPSDTPDRSADTSRAVGLEREPLFYAPGDCTYEIALQLSALDTSPAWAGLGRMVYPWLADSNGQRYLAATSFTIKTIAVSHGQTLGNGRFDLKPPA